MSVSDTTQMFQDAHSLKTINGLNTINSQNFTEMFENAWSIEKLELDMLNGVVFSNDTFLNLYSLTSLRIFNMPVAFNVVNLGSSNLDASALEIVFNDLYDRTATTAGTIIITNAYGASDLTTVQREIATNKNWNITG